MSLAVLGIGNIGTAFTRRIATVASAESFSPTSLYDGKTILAWNRTASSLDSLKSFGNIKCMSSVEETINASSTLVLTFASYQIASELFSQISSLENKIVFPLMAGHPNDCLEFHQMLVSKGARTIDGMVLSLPAALEKGQSQIYYATPHKSLQNDLKTFCSSFGEAIALGENLAAAKAVELFTGATWQASYIGVCSAMAFADKYDVSPEVQKFALNSVFNTMKVVGAKAIDKRENGVYCPAEFALKNLRKSVSKHVNIAKEMDAPQGLAFHQARLAVVENSISATSPDHDIAAMYETFNPGTQPANKRTKLKE